MLKTSSHVLSTLEKAYDLVPREKLWGVLREFSVDGRQATESLLRSLCPCRES